MNKKDHKIVKKQTTIEKPKGRKFLTPKVIWGYATGQLGWAIIAGVMASLITKVWLGWDAKPNDVSTAWGGYVYAAHAFIFAVVFGVTKLADAFAAPIIGRWSDKVNTKWGRRIPFLVVALAPMGIAAIFAFFAISNPSHEQSIINLVLLVCLFIIFYISLNMYVIPYTALINDLAKSSEDRVKLTTATAIMYLLGTVLAFGTTMLWGMMHKILGGNYQIAIIVSVAIVVLLGVGFMLFPIFVVKEKKWVEIKKGSHENDEKLFKMVGSILKDKQFKWMLLADFFLWVGIIGFNTQVIYVVTAILGIDGSKTIYFSGIMAVVALVSYVVIGKIMNSIGVRKKFVFIGFVWFTIMFIAGSLLMLTTNKITHPGIAWGEGIALVALIAVPNAIMGVVKNVIFSDIIETNTVVLKEDKSASYWAVRNLTSKVGMAIGMVVSASLLAAAKDGVMSEELAMRLIFVFGAVMLVIGGISLMLYKEVKYRFNKEFYKFLRIQKESDALLEKINKLSASLKKEKEADKKADLTKEITKLKSLHKESIKEQEECLELSKKKIDASTKKEITHIQNKITHLNKGNHKNKEEKLIRFEKDIKTYNNIRSGMSIKEL